MESQISLFLSVTVNPVEKDLFLTLISLPRLGAGTEYLNSFAYMYTHAFKTSQCAHKAVREKRL